MTAEWGLQMINTSYRLLINKVPQIGVILGGAGDPERLPPTAAMNAALLHLRSGYPPSASMTAHSMAPLRHLANQVLT